MSPAPLTLEITGFIFGTLGSALLAFNGSSARWGWPLYLVSNVGWLAFAIAGSFRFMALQQLVFMAISLIGIWRWIVVPWVDSRYQHVLEQALRAPVAVAMTEVRHDR